VGGKQEEHCREGLDKFHGGWRGTVLNVWLAGSRVGKQKKVSKSDDLGKWPSFMERRRERLFRSGMASVVKGAGGENVTRRKSSE